MNALKLALATPAYRWLLQLTVLITAFALLLPWDPQGPFDARTLERIDGVSLAYPWWGVLFEPIFAPAHMLMGSPDFRLTIFTTLGWIAILALLLSLWHQLRQTPRPHPLRIGWRMLRTMLFSVGLYLAYVIAAAVLHFPSWSLVVESPEWVAADLQSHTVNSHDGVITAEKSLAWHKRLGYDVYAVTEHNDATGSFATRDLADRTDGAPVVIPGVEVSAAHGDFLLGIGLDDNDFAQVDGDRKSYARRFSEDLHASHDGAVIALSWKVAPERVDTLVDAGVDAFELVNTGHPDVSNELREAMLRAEKERGVVMLASTDWHGWGGFSRTWTLVHIPDNADLSRDALAERVVTLLRERKQEAFIPVLSGYTGEVPLLRTALSPVAETVRYAAELSAPRIAAWWGWFILLVAVHAWLVRRGFSGGRVIFGLAGLTLGGLLLWRASEMYGLWEGIPATPYTLHNGQFVLLFGAIALLMGIVALVRGLWRKGETVEEVVEESEAGAEDGG